MFSFLFFIFAFGSLSQGLKLNQISLMGGKNFSSFRFRDSDGNKDKTLDFVALNSFGINANFSANKHILRPELMLRQAGAKSDINGTALSWLMNYLDLNVAYLYSFLQTERFSVSPGLAVGFGYMQSGEQYIGTMRYSLVSTKALSRFDCGLQGITNFKAQISENINLSFEYRFGMGITQIEKDVTPQKTYNIYHSALLGLGLIIK